MMEMFIDIMSSVFALSYEEGLAKWDHTYHTYQLAYVVGYQSSQLIDNLNTTDGQYMLECNIVIAN